MTKPTEYTLDVSKWRCGGDGKHSLGEGLTLMLNNEGYMCCLGQFAKQAGVEDTVLQFASEPHSLQIFRSRPDLYDSNFIQESNDYCGRWKMTELARELININDDPDTTASEKINLLSAALANNNITLKVLDPNNQLEAFNDQDN